MTITLETQVAGQAARKRGPEIRASQRPGLLWIGNHLSKTRGGTAASEDVIERLRGLGWRISGASSQRSQILRLAEMVGTALRKRREYSVGIIDVFSGKAFRYAEILMGLLGRMRKPVVLILHGGALLEFQVEHPERVRRLLTRASLVVSPSRYLARGFGRLRPDIVQIPNGLDIQRYKLKKRSQARPSLCWLRALHQTYNPVMAVECLARLRREFPTARLRMVGPDKGDGAWELTQARARELRVQDALTLTGPVPRALVPDTLQKDDVFLNTTNYDSFGVSTLEAAASGLCVVATAVGESQHLWRDTHDALLVPVNDGAAMAAATRSILLNREIASRLSGNGRRKAEQFDWSVILPRWEELLMGMNGEVRDPTSAAFSDFSGAYC